MHIQAKVSILINRLPAEVFAWLTNFSQWPQWGGGNLVSLEQTSPGPLQAGSQLRQVNRAGRKQAETFVQVTHFMPDQTLGIERSKLRGIFTLEPAGTGTRLNASFEAEATGLSAQMYRLLLKQFVTSDLRRFKALVESS